MKSIIVTMVANATRLDAVSEAILVATGTLNDPYAPWHVALESKMKRTKKVSTGIVRESGSQVALPGDNR